MNRMIKSKSFTNYLLKLLNKLSIDDIEEKEINTITDIVLVKNDKDDDYNFIDLEMFPNLKELVLINFKINNFETNVLNRCKSLQKVEFVDCKIVSKSRLLNNNITNLSISNCKVKNVYFSKAKNLKILNVKNIKLFDAKKIVRLINLEELRVNDTKIKSSKYLSSVAKLKFLNLTGSKYDKELECSLSSNIVFEK